MTAGTKAPVMNVAVTTVKRRGAVAGTIKLHAGDDRHTLTFRSVRDLAEGEGTIGEIIFPFSLARPVRRPVDLLLNELDDARCELERARIDWRQSIEVDPSLAVLIKLSTAGLCEWVTA